MARAYASTIIDAPVETVWDVVRDFNALPQWHPAIGSSEIEGGLRQMWLDAFVPSGLVKRWCESGCSRLMTAATGLLIPS